jgi:hypothetical protein
MPGIATHFTILDRTIQALDAAGMQSVADVMRNNPWAYFGAVGASIGDFLPCDPPPAGQTPPPSYSFIWKLVFGVVGGDPGLLATLSKLNAVLDKITTIANNEDCDALKAMRDSGELDSVMKTAQDFGNLILDVQSQALAIMKLITTGVDDTGKLTGIQPVFCRLKPTDPIPPPNQWPARDFLHWKKTGQFASKLLKLADDSGDDRLRAYAYGWLVSYAANTCGSPFVGSAVGGPPRTQWWRQRFIRNWVDAWVFGYYGAGASIKGDTPNPGYDSWPSLCNANLHTKMQITQIDPVSTVDAVKRAKPFPAAVPDDFAQLWFQALNETYQGNLPDGVSKDSLNGAYVMTWLMLWLQTSTDVFPCNLTMSMTPPGDCGEQPGELDPFQPAPGGGPTPPPDPTPQTHDNEVCGILLMILGILGILTGNVVAGAAAVAEAGHLLSCSAAVEWADFRCKLFWLRIYLFNGLTGLHKLLSYAAFRYPEGPELGSNDNSFQLLGIPVKFDSSINLVKSRSTNQDKPYPSKCWGGDLLSYGQYPDAANPGIEQPSTIAYLTATYPNFFVDDAANPLANGDVKTDGGFPFRAQPPGGAAILPVPFGNAVANVVDLFQNLGADLPDWNLDADRGMAYFTWQFKGHYDPDNVQIEPEP